MSHLVICFLTPFVNSLSASPTKLSNTLKEFLGNLLTNSLSVFDSFVGLAFKWFRSFTFKDPFMVTHRVYDSDLNNGVGKAMFKIYLKKQCSYRLLLVDFTYIVA